MFFKSEAKGFSTGRPGPYLCQGEKYETHFYPRPSHISHWASPLCHTLTLPFLIFLLETSWLDHALFCIQNVIRDEGRQDRKLLSGSVLVVV